MKWVTIENHPENNSNRYYIQGDTQELILKENDERNEIKCKLPDGSEKKLPLLYQAYLDMYEHGTRVKYEGPTKRWFVKDNETLYQIEDILVSKEDIEKYKK